MIELYGMGSPNVVKIYVALEELGLAYTVHPVDVFAGKQFDADFLKLNPLAKVPSPAPSCFIWPRRPVSCCPPASPPNTRRSSG
jgi:hypothetical protein